MDAIKKREMITRIIVGLILIPLAIYVALLAPLFVFLIVIVILSVLAIREFIPLLRQYNTNVRSVGMLMFVGAISIPIFAYLKRADLFALFTFTSLFLFFLLKMFSDKPTENVVQEISLNLFVTLFIPSLFATFILVRAIDPKWLVWLFFVIWASDTFAYFTGMSIGKHKLIPKVSPGKTVEGLIGGVIGALVIAFLFNYFFLHINLVLLSIIAIDVILAGVIGDLAESMLKRSALVKDSGHLIPGHGGVLDRFDSLLFAAPVLLFYLHFFVRG